MITEINKYKNYNHFKELLENFDSLNLNIGEYAIFGSGPLAIRGLVYAGDVDIIIKKEFWKYRDIREYETIRIGNFELSNSWPGFDINLLIDTSEVIENYSFVKIEYVLQYKENLKRDKDIETLKRIKNMTKISS